ncbi:hypothetical protein OG250_25840 [Streptomyces sp. NBC_00487]|uniref:hypothetical protein n=1 Tax=unclassified Streptomyces TaxID=2593676 RepID=UPI002DDBC9DB|nr:MULTISPECIES: hypothetical protein [unclassified Streptomyces]WRY97957.1 hypothetical protein OG889_26620 [Streptomyces sp. NBC_00481]
MTGPDALRRENGIVLDAVQALLGLISSDVIAVAVLVEAHRVELTFWVRGRTPEIEEDVDQAVFELDALFSEEHPLIESRIHVGHPDPTMLGSYGRMIYWAK